MAVYTTLVEGINDLKKKGYDQDFNLRETYIECASTKQQLPPSEFEITEVHRFEGMTNPSDQTILYAIESKHGLKGVLVNAYGVYADPISQELVTKLSVHK